jgi:hypothetical protein
MDVLYICATVVLTALLCGLVHSCAKLRNKQ